MAIHLDVTGLAAGDYVITVSAKASGRRTSAAVQTFNVTVAGTSGLTVSIDTPSAGVQRRAASFTVTGYALTGKGSGPPGVDAVQVWAYPVGGGAAKLLGEATLGVSRPDIGVDVRRRHHQRAASASRWRLSPSGTYDLVVYARGTSAESGAPRGPRHRAVDQPISRRRHGFTSRRSRRSRRSQRSLVIFVIFTAFVP